VLDKINSITPQKNLAVIDLGDYPLSVVRGDVLDNKRLRLAFQLIEELNNTDLLREFEITKINASGSNSISFFLNDVEVIIGRDDFAKRLSDLDNLIKKKYNNNLESVRYIDLRYASSDEELIIGNKR
jgi:cell division septal protein FtsQ